MRGKGSGKRLVSLFLGCALIVVGLIGPQVVGRADGELGFKTEGFTPVYINYGEAKNISFEGELDGSKLMEVNSNGSHTAELKAGSASISVTPSYEYSTKKITFNTSTDATTKPGEYELKVKVQMDGGSEKEVIATNKFTVKAPDLTEASVSKTTVTTDSSITFSGKITNVSGGSITGDVVKALFERESGTEVLTSTAFSVTEGESFSNINVPVSGDAAPGKYVLKELTGSNIFSELVFTATKPSFTVTDGATAPTWGTAVFTPEVTEAVATGASLTFTATVDNKPTSITSAEATFIQSGGSHEAKVNITTLDSLTGTLTVPDAPGKTYNLTSMSINGTAVAGTVPFLSFSIKDNAPTTPTLTSFVISPELITKNDSVTNGAFTGQVENLPASVSTSAIFTRSDGTHKITTSEFTVKNKENFTQISIPITSTTPTGRYYLTSMPGITGLNVPENKYSFEVRDASDPQLTEVIGIKDKAEPYSAGQQVLFNAKFENIKLTGGNATIGGTITFENINDAADRIEANFKTKTNVVTNSSWTVENIKTDAIPDNTTGSVKTYRLKYIEGTDDLEKVTIKLGAHKEFTVSPSTTPAAKVTAASITNQKTGGYDRMDDIKLQLALSNLQDKDTLVKAYFNAEQCNDIVFETTILKDDISSGDATKEIIEQAPTISNGNHTFTLYKVVVDEKTADISSITTKPSFVVNESPVQEPILSTIAIGSPSTYNGSTRIPLSATLQNRGNTSGVTNEFKWIEIDYSIDEATTTSTAYLLAPTGDSLTFASSVERSFVNGTTHKIRISAARLCYWEGRRGTEESMKIRGISSGELSQYITSNPLTFTVNNYTPTPVNPVNPVDPSNPSTPANNTVVNQRAANTITAMANNGSATLDYTSSPTVSANIFDLLRGTQKTVNLLAPGGFIWTFNGATITGASKQIDLRVTATTLAATGATNSFPLVASLTGNRPVVILNFANNGVLPGTATITIPMSQHRSYIGTSNIYQYFVNENTRRLEKIGGPVTISSGNTVTMAINHNSTYILTYGEVAGATAPTTVTNDVLPIYNANATPTVNTPTNTTPTGGTTINTVYRPGSTSPKTGDAFRMYVWVGMLLIGAFLVFASVLWPKKKEKSA